MKHLATIALYSWLYLFLLILGVVFPPFFALFALPPFLHFRRKRMRSSPEWREARDRARRAAWLDSL